MAEVMGTNNQLRARCHKTSACPRRAQCERYRLAGALLHVRASSGAQAQEQHQHQRSQGQKPQWLGFKRHIESAYKLPATPNEKPIGAGAYGIVRRAVHMVTGNEFAVKSIPKLPRKQNTPVEPYVQKLKNEVSIMRSIGPSLNIVYLYDVFEDEDQVHMVMEYMKGGALWKRIHQGHYSERQAAEMMQCILRTVAQCHARNVVYRDVKPENFLYVNDADGAPLKATDFGLATYYEEGMQLTRLCGTPSYMAPELIGKNYGPAADVWSAGVIAHQLLTGNLPFRKPTDPKMSAQDIMKAVQTRDIEFTTENWQEVSKDGKEFVAMLLQKDPSARPSAREALEHHWLSDSPSAAGGAPQTPLHGSVVRRLQRYATAGILKRSILRVLVENTPETLSEELSELQSLFKRFDIGNSGSLSLKELADGLRRSGYRVTQQEAEQLMLTLDTDRSGSVSNAEFIAALIDWHDLQEIDFKMFTEWVNTAFELIDADSDGLVDALDVESMIGGSAPPGYRMSDIIAEADKDGDGMIDRAEFLRLVNVDHGDVLEAYDARLDVYPHESIDESFYVAE